MTSFRAFSDPENDADLTALHVGFERYPTLMPESLRLSHERFERRAVCNEEIRRERERQHIRMRDLDRTDATEHFLSLTGYEIGELPAPKRASSVSRNAVGIPGHRVDRLPIERMTLRSAVLAATIIFFWLSAGSYRNDPLAGPLAAFGQSESMLFGNLGQTVRGHEGQQGVERNEAIREALGAIDAARTSILGFHTGYERDALMRADEALERAIQSATPAEPTTTTLILLRDHVRLLVARP